jgi:BirA family biotin operon repressor/biotin-[acetyl-CoA-carboxylase] ligase
MFTGVPADRASKGAEFARRQLAGQRFGDIRWVEATGSTNSDVMALARDGAGEGTVVVADHQSAGRGRRGRTWTAPPGSSLLVSVLLRPPAAVAGAASMAAGVAMAGAVATATQGRCQPRLKWPNDLVVGGAAGGHGADRADGADRKLAGILAEADWPAGVTDSSGWRRPPAYERVPVVVGVGENVNWPGGPDDLPDQLAETAVALNHLVGHEVDRAELLVAFLRRLDEVYGALVAAGSTKGLLHAWRERSATLGRRVRVDLGADDIDGTAVDVTDEGHLVVATDDGVRRVLAVGDVVHLRPAASDTQPHRARDAG